MTFQLEKRLISVSDYYKMAEVGILAEEEKVELLNGEIFKKIKKTPRHAGHVMKMSALFYKILKKQSATISIHAPVMISDFSEVEPDVALLKFDTNFYAEAHPRPENVLLLIEVSDATLRKDKKVKLPIYAAAKIKEYWIVNLVDNCIEVYKKPNRDDYELRQTYRYEDEIELTDFNLKIKISDILVK